MKQFAKALDRVGRFARRCYPWRGPTPGRATRFRRTHRPFGPEALEARTLLSVGGANVDPWVTSAAVEWLDATLDADAVAVEMKVVADDGAADDQFGSAMAIDGDLMVVGSWGDDDLGDHSGSAYVYHFDGSDWIQEAKLTADDGQPGDSFGVSVAISGETVVVGAWGDDDDGTASGSAYVFSRHIGGDLQWGLWDRLSPGPDASGYLFGHSVTIDGDTIAVGAYADSTAGQAAGRVHLFAPDDPDAGDGWHAVGQVVAEDAAVLDNFGFSVALDADTLVVGAHKDDDGGSNSGSAYIFDRDSGGEGNWGQAAKLTADDAAAHDLFGCSVAVAGDTVIVGASQDDDAGSLSGSAYIFGRDAGGQGLWGQMKKLTATDAAAGDRFGISVAVAADTAVIGSYKADTTDYNSGSAYVFESDRGGEGQWGQLLQLAASDAAAQDFFGSSVAVSGDTIAVAAYGDDDRGSLSGSAYLYRLALADYGDAPAPYATLDGENGARHKVGSGLFLGESVDADFDGQPSIGAVGDDADRADDEDGVVFAGTLVPDGVIDVEITASADGLLDAWIDFDGSGDWNDPAEQIFASQPLLAGVNALSVEVPTTVTTNDVTYARFRISSAGGLTPVGEAMEGEVEDHAVAVNVPPVAGDDSYLAFVDMVLEVDQTEGLLANDTDTGGDTLRAFLVGDPSHGSLAFFDDGSFVYTPDPSYMGPDSFTYMAGDGELESGEATVTIQVAQLPTMAIGGAAVIEGNAGTTSAVFNVSLSNAIDAPVTVDYVTVDDTAVAGSDYLAAGGTLTFAPGETEQAIVVTLIGDEAYETHESFVVRLSNPVHAILGVDVAEGTILNDDTLIEAVELSFSSESGYFTVAADGTLPVKVSLVNSSEQFFGFQLAFNNSDITYGRLHLTNWRRAPVWDAAAEDVLNTPVDNFVAAGAFQAVSVPIDLGTLDVIAPKTPGQYVLSTAYTEGGAFSTGLVGLSGLIPVDSYGDVIITVVDDPIPPIGNLAGPMMGEDINEDPGYLDVQWIDPGPPASGVNPNLIGVEDIVIDNDGTILSVERVEAQAGGVYRYYYADDGETLTNGPVDVTFVGGQIADIAGNPIAETTQQFQFDLEAPTVVSVEMNVGAEDPPDLGEEDPQPSNWATQRSEMRTIVVTFDREVALTAADIRLVNLGIDAPAEDDVVIPLDDSQLALAGEVLTIGFAPNQLPNGVYELEILPTATDLAGNPLDGNGDGTPGDSFVFTGDATNLFYKLNGDFNGDMAVSILDLPTIAYWFGHSTDEAPEYVDMNVDGAISMFDWPFFVVNFGRSVVFPEPAGAIEPLDAGVVSVSALDDGLVMDLVPSAGVVSFDPDGTKVVSVPPSTTIQCTVQVISSPDGIAGYQLNFSSSDDAPGELVLSQWVNNDSVWPLDFPDVQLSSPDQHFVAAAGPLLGPLVEVPPAVDLGSFQVVAPAVLGDYLISVASGGSGPFDTSFLGPSVDRLPVDDFGDVVVRVTGDIPTSATVAGRYVFYNNSTFDDPADGRLDDDAIAPDKTALLPGETAEFANYTSYSAGINGIMIDVAGIANAAAVGPHDFRFRVGNSENVETWQPAPVPQVSVRPAEGHDDTDRVTLIWDDNAIEKQWLQVTMLASANTGLGEDDVFYFGNAVGEAGNSSLEAMVTSVDEVLARNHPQIFVPAEISNPYDFNRDRMVSATDQILARNNVEIFRPLALITVPANDAAMPQSADEDAAAVETSSDELPWLDDLAAAEQNRASDNDDSVQRAVDALLASF